MTLFKNTVASLTIILWGLCLLGCQGSETPDQDQAGPINTAYDQAYCMQATLALLAHTENLLEGNLSTGNCPPATTGPDTLLAAYGNGCTATNTVPLQGTLRILLPNQPYRQANSIVNVEFDGFALGGIKFSGLFRVINRGNNYYDIILSNQSGNSYATLRTDTATLQYKCNLRVLLTDTGQPTTTDNKIEVVSGSFTGVAGSGLRYEGNVNQKLLVNYQCWFGLNTKRLYPHSGSVDFTPNGWPIRQLRYINSNGCATQAYYTVLNRTNTISLF